MLFHDFVKGCDRGHTSRFSSLKYDMCRAHETAEASPNFSVTIYAHSHARLTSHGRCILAQVKSVHHADCLLFHQRAGAASSNRLCQLLRCCQQHEGLVRDDEETH